MRYNFVQPNARVVPFIQIGGGAAYSDAASDDTVQRLIGDDLSFQIHSMAGLRVHLSERCAFTAAAYYLHLSNAGLTDPNQGLDSVGGMLGVSWFY